MPAKRLKRKRVVESSILPTLHGLDSTIHTLIQDFHQSNKNSTKQILTIGTLWNALYKVYLEYLETVSKYIKDDTTGKALQEKDIFAQIITFLKQRQEEATIDPIKSVVAFDTNRSQLKKYIIEIIYLYTNS